MMLTAVLADRRCLHAIVVLAIAAVNLFAWAAVVAMIVLVAACGGGDPEPAACVPAPAASAAATAHDVQIPRDPCADERQ